MDDKARQAADDYISSIQQRLHRAEYVDSRQERIDAFRPSELQAVSSLISQFAAATAQNKKLEAAIELAEDARKHVITHFGLFPLIESLRPRGIFYLACDGNAESRAELEMFTLRILSPRIEFGTWDKLVPRLENNYAAVTLAGCVVIGDLDWSGARVEGTIRDQRVQGVQLAMRTSTCHRIVLHQKGKESIVTFPPNFKGHCFIATAAAGSPDAWEVQTLRAYRDDVLSQSPIGRGAVYAYNRLSPPFARAMERRPWARKLVRKLFVTPLAVRIRRARRG